MFHGNQVRSIALFLPEAEEKSHFEHPDFRVRNEIFATLWPDGRHAVVKLDAGERMALMVRPDVFSVPRGGDPGGWSAMNLAELLARTGGLGRITLGDAD